MFKKIAIVVGLTILLPTLFFGRSGFSYLKTAGSSVRDAVKNEVPPEFEIKRIQDLVDNLVPEIRDCMHVIAEQQVDIEHLGEQVARRENDLGDQEKILLSMTNDLESGKSEIQYASHTYSSDEVERDLAHRFEKFKVAQDALERDQKILKAREKTLFANQQKLEQMLAAKQDLAVEVAQLESRLKSIQAAETVSELSIDDSQLAQAKQAIRDLNKTLDVKERMLEVDVKFVDLIPTQDVRPVPQDLSRQIRKHLGRESQEPQNEEASLVLRKIGE